jgi:hypothetical protein
MRTFRDNLADDNLTKTRYQSKKIPELSDLVANEEKFSRIQQKVYDTIPPIVTLALFIVLFRVDRYGEATIVTLREFEPLTRSAPATTTQSTGQATILSGLITSSTEEKIDKR